MFPQTQVELVYDLIRRSALHSDRIFVATHSPYILYALNNCMQGYLVKDCLPENLRGKADSWLNPKEVAVWELREGELSSEVDETFKTVLLRKAVTNDEPVRYYIGLSDKGMDYLLEEVANFL